MSWKNRKKWKYFIGSQLAPTSGTLSRFASELQYPLYIPDLRNTLTLVDIHNKMAMYTLILLSYATGHRSVTSPYHKRDIIDLRNNIVFIEDKVVSQKHQVRVCPLPEIAVEQLHNYIEHLLALSRLLPPKHSQLARYAYSIAKESYPRPIPLFFTISERTFKWKQIKPSTVKAYISDISSLETNTNRHVMSKWLREHEVHSEYIDALLGHIENGCDPFGDYSPHAPLEFTKETHTCLNELLKSADFVPRKGLSAKQGKHRFFIKATVRSLKTGNIFGPESRALKREEKWLDDSRHVQSLFKEYIDDDSSTSIDDETIDNIHDNLCDDSTKDRYLIRYTLFRREVLRRRKRGVEVKLPARMAISKPAPSPITRQTYKDLPKANQIRRDLVTIFENSNDQQISLERRLAEILVSSVVFGAQLNLAILDKLTKAIVRDTQVYEEFLFVDVPIGDEEQGFETYRWFPDHISSALISCLFRNISKKFKKYSETLIDEFTADILGKIGVLKEGQKIDRGLTKLISIMQSHWTISLPGVLREYSNGNLYSPSIPTNNLVRLISNKRLKTSVNNNQNEQLSLPFSDFSVASVRLTNDPLLRASTSFWKSLSTKIGEVDSSNIRSIKKKRRLISVIEQHFKQHSNNIPSAAHMLTLWMLSLCREGTSHTEKIKPSSVVTYSRTIGLPLMEEAHAIDIFTCSDIQFEEIYRAIVERAGNKDARKYAFHRLWEFHSFLQRTIQSPPLDWSEVYDGQASGVTRVDSGLISYTEYSRALEMLLNDEYVDDRTKALHGTVLLYGYHFGMRPSEIFKLTVNDIEICEPQPIVYVRNNIYGEGKTENAVRQIPLVYPLTAKENSLIRQWIAHIDSYADTDHLAALISQEGQRRSIYDRNRAVTRVVEALRTVSGDNDVRFRHLRHSYASRLFVASFYENIPDGNLGKIYKSLNNDVEPKKIRETLTWDTNKSYRFSYAIAVALGHSSPRVSLLNYIHIADISLHDYLKNQNININAKGLAYLYSTTSDNIRKIFSRSSKPKSLETLHEHFFKKLPNSIRLDPEFEEIPDHLSPISSEEKDTDISPETVDRLLFLIGLKQSIDGLAEGFFVSQSVVRNILTIGSRLQKNIRYEHFNLPVFEEEDEWLPPSLKLSDTFAKQSRRVRQFLSLLTNLSEIRPEIHELVSIWRTSYSAEQNGLLITKKSHLSKFIDLCQLLGISKNNFEVFLPQTIMNSDIDRWTEAYSKLERQNILVNKWRSTTDTVVTAKVNLYPRLILRTSKDNILSYQNSLDRTLFTLSVWFEVTK